MSVAAPRLLFFFRSRTVGLTPQAKYLSPLRGSASVTQTHGVFFRAVVLGLAPQAIYLPPLRGSARLTHAHWGLGKPRRGVRFIAWGVSPRNTEMQHANSPGGATDFGCGVSRSHRLLVVCRRSASLTRTHCSSSRASVTAPMAGSTSSGLTSTSGEARRPCKRRMRLGHALKAPPDRTMG